jgi:hypothetical protein
MLHDARSRRRGLADESSRTSKEISMAGNEKAREKPQESVRENIEGLSIDRPRLTPQGRTSPDEDGEDSTNPLGEGAKQGQGDKAEG